jgi:putative tetratricopeptide repeat-containing domain protein
LGESLYELNCIEEAKDPLMRAYMPEGEEIFDDNKYFDVIKDLI